MKNIVFLHSQLSGYFISSVLNALQNNLEIEVHIIVTPNTFDAPFEFSKLSERIKIYNRKDFDYPSLSNLLNNLNPNSIILCGWNDKLYLKIAKGYKNKIPLTIAMDNLWYGQFRQYLGLIYSRIFLVNLFNYIWVPGIPQKEYAKLLGFKKKQILLSSYCADLEKFKKFYSSAIKTKEQNFPHRFLFVGRYVSQKGLDNLCEAFAALQNENPNDWELVCVGSGPLFETRVIMNKIIHKGFIQPEDFQSIISETGVFVLPSWEEHWGVVLHEYAAAGYPLICSDAVGAASTFINNNVNGFVFQAKNIVSLKEKLLKIVKTPDNELLKMGYESVLMSKEVTNEKWNMSFEKTMKFN
jgi:glycosyltransferase involved in cell wall biosynthesis